MVNAIHSFSTLLSTILISFVICSSSIGQAPAANLIIKVDPALLAQEHREIQLIEGKTTEVLFAELGLLFLSDVTKEEEQNLINNPSVINFWYDQEVQVRDTPNDALYSDQWAITISKIDEVWDIYKGGQTVNGDNIVIAILDDGFDLDHVDLRNNWYINPNEIPNNNIDDDNNGYIDDVNGINVTDDNGTHPPENHGTSAASLLGAENNNNEGIASACHTIQVLPISNVRSVSRIIKSYDYIYQLRKDYNESNGNKGAYIAVTSYSGGVDDVFPTEGIFKEWCEIYDLLGSVGILNFGATTNRFVNVDEDGDMPTTCESPYLVGITSLRRDGKHDNATAFGISHIDIAAPGNGLIAAFIDDTYDNFDGTSAATPMAASTAALLFSIPCSNLGDLLRLNPKEGALLIKEALLEGATKTDELSNLTLSGGYLNAIESVKYLADGCEDLVIKNEPGPLKIESILQSNQTITIGYVTPNFNSHFIRAVDPKGSILFYEPFTPVEFGNREIRFDLPLSITGPIYITLGNSDRSVSQGFFLRR